MRDGFAWVLGRAGELEGLGTVEGCCEADFAGFFGVDLDVLASDSCSVWRRFGAYAFEGGF